MERITINLATGRYVGRGVGTTLPVAIIILGLMLLWHTGSSARGLSQEIERVSKKVAELSEKRSSKSAMKAVLQKDSDKERLSLASTAEIMEQRSFSWIGALDNLEKAIPPNVSLISIQPSFKESGVKLSGHAKDFLALSRFIDNLERLRVYKRVLLINHSATETEEGREAVLFNISIEGGK